MPEPMKHIKIELVKRGKKIKDLVNSLGMNYSHVSRILNGFENKPINFDKRVAAVFKEWDEKNGAE